MLEMIIQEPTQTADACVIWLHGLGADGYDFADLVPMLNLPQDHRIRFIFPHAPVQPITLNGGIPMRAWFDILSLDADSRYDREGILKAEQSLRELIDAQIQSGIPSERIILAGFSQGGATILFTGLRYPKPLAGLIALSSFIPEHEMVAESLPENHHKLPIFMGHGNQDPLVKFEWGEASRDVLTELAYPVDWHAYPMAHSVCPEEVADVAQWCQQRLLTA